MSDSKPDVHFDFQTIIRESVKEVGHTAFHTLYKVLTDGLPPDNELGNSLWHSDLCKEQLSETDARKVARLALEVETHAEAAILRMFTSPGFMQHLLEDMVSVHARRLRKSQKRSAAEIIREYLQENAANVDQTTKAALKTLEQNGKIRSFTDSSDYLIVDEDRPESEWRRVTDSGIRSTFSNLRKELRRE